MKEYVTGLMTVIKICSFVGLNLISYHLAMEFESDQLPVEIKYEDVVPMRNLS